ncbi:MAG TPA: P1 family peptidase [Candidatus Sulfotelmatobacter sp.]|nr:P1 family peptidase [Candidatus Sulfotelmatobacter sp.]
MLSSLDRAVPGTITDVAGLAVGHWTAPARSTGCTVVCCGPDGAVAACDVRGGAPGTRETDVLGPFGAVERAHAILLSGGSAFGLDAAGGVVRWLEEHGIGYATPYARVPIVPAAILYDLGVGDPAIRPDAAAGYAACAAASGEPPAEGNVGAGAGATVGKLFGLERAMKGGIGTASVRVGGVTVGALVAVNAIGDVFDGPTPLAGLRTPDGRALAGSVAALLAGQRPTRARPATATTIGVVATDVALDKLQTHLLARVAHDGLPRAIAPVHTGLDGDALFALATGTNPAAADATVLGAMAAEAVRAAIVRAIRAARGIPGFPSAADLARAASTA